MRNSQISKFFIALDAINGQGRFGDIRGENNFPCSRRGRLEYFRLQFARQICIYGAYDHLADPATQALRKGSSDMDQLT